MKQEMLLIWYKRAESVQKCHYLASHRYDRYNYYLGVPTILITALVGTSVFASLHQNSYSKNTAIFLGLISILGAIFSSLQTFLSYNERAERHRSAAVRFGALGRKLELLLSDQVELSRDETLSLKEEIDRLGVDSPKIPLDILKNFDNLYKDVNLEAYNIFTTSPKEKK